MSAALHALATSLAALSASREGGPFPRDAALPDPEPTPVPERGLTWATVRERWLAQIAAEEHKNSRVDDYLDVRVDPADGALMRGGAGLAYTPTAWTQLYGLLLHGVGRPVNAHGVDRWHHPLTRAVCYEDVRSRAVRQRNKRAAEAMVFRTFLDAASGLRALRAVVSTRHSVDLLDDKAVIANFDPLAIPDDAPAWYHRHVDETVASVEVQRVGDLGVTLHLRNSETNGSGLYFSVGLRLRLLDLDLRDRATQVTLVDEQGARTRRNHTMRQREAGRALTREEQVTIARERIQADIAKALERAKVLTAAWARALTDIRPMPEAGGWEVLLDAIQETRGIAHDEARDLGTVLRDDARLKSVPHGSAAHVAAAYAALAQRASTYKEHLRLQETAGEWLLDGWGGGHDSRHRTPARHLAAHPGPHHGRDGPRRHRHKHGPPGRPPSVPTRLADRPTRPANRPPRGGGREEAQVTGSPALPVIGAG